MPVLGNVKFGEDNSIEDAPQLTEEDLHTLKKKMEALDLLLERDQKGKYKIELFFSFRRNTREAVPGMLSFWESGTKLNGGGDAKIYICPGKSLKKSECEAFIPDSSNGYGYLCCPKCGQVWKGEDVSGEILARLTMQGWAQLIHKYFVRLGHNADIYVKHPREDIRSTAGLEQEKQMGGELLERSRSKIVSYIYPLKHIIKDTQNGKDPLTQFYNLLKA
jgi:hypothetical protein